MPSATKPYLIWWVSEHDCKQLGEPHRRSDWTDYGETPPAGDGIYWLDQSPLPDYIQREYSSRYGRGARGRLWVPREIPVEGIPIPPDHPLTPWIDQAGGIVFHVEHLDLVRGLPGFITTLDLEHVR